MRGFGSFGDACSSLVATDGIEWSYGRLWTNLLHGLPSYAVNLEQPLVQAVHGCCLSGLGGLWTNCALSMLLVAASVSAVRTLEI